MINRTKSEIDAMDLQGVEHALEDLDSKQAQAERQRTLEIRDNAQRWLDERAEYKVALQRKQVELLQRKVNQTKAKRG